MTAGRSLHVELADEIGREHVRLLPALARTVSVSEVPTRSSPRANLADDGNPRSVAKPTVAYLWVRTVPCAGCRQDVPLLKTRWLCKRGRKRVRLNMTTGANGVIFGVKSGAPVGKGARRSGAGGIGCWALAPCPAAASPVRAAASRRPWRICAPRAAPDAWASA